jgi:hypothetical protein
MLMKKGKDIVEGESVSDWDGITCTFIIFLGTITSRSQTIVVYLHPTK